MLSSTPSLICGCELLLVNVLGEHGIGAVVYRVESAIQNVQVNQPSIMLRH